MSARRPSEPAERIDAALCRCVEAGPVLSPTGLRVESIERRPFEGETAFPVEVLTISLSDGSWRRIFFKNLETSRIPKDDLPGRRRREWCVYRNLLAEAGLGTARLYGAEWQPGRFWLLLEFVEGKELRRCGFDERVAAAGWLGRMHGCFAGRRDELSRCEFLLRHDEAFFADTARRAMEAVRSRDTSLARRLEAVLRGYDDVVELLAAQPRSLVHGSYRQQNILVAGAEAGRVVPVDWELAAVGSPLYDFAFLARRFEPALVKILCDAYRREAEAHGAVVPDDAEILRLVDCFRLHKRLKSLSDSVALDFRPRTVEKLVARAASITASIARGRE